MILIGFAHYALTQICKIVNNVKQFVNNCKETKKKILQ